VTNEKLIILKYKSFIVQFFRFGVLGGFQKLSGRFESNKTLTISIISGLIKPFGSCSELLTESTILKHLMPIVVCTFFKYL